MKSGRFNLNSFYSTICVCLIFLGASHLPMCVALAQGALVNGFTHTGAISTLGGVDTWDFDAVAGDHVIIRMGNITNASSFEPWIRIYNPDGVLVGERESGSNVDSAEVSIVVTNSGNFSVLLADITISPALGLYGVTLAKSPGPITVAPGDEGGGLTNGYMHMGWLGLGDLDVWQFDGAVGDQIILRLGAFTNVSNWEPYLRVYDPNGVEIFSDAANSQIDSVEAEFMVTNSGTFTVVVAESAGTTENLYRLTLVKSPGAIAVAPGDEGGWLINGVVAGSIDIGDLDVWTFIAFAGDAFTLQVTELTGGSGFVPTLRLFAPNGVMTNSASGATSAQINRTAPLTGTYILVLGDNNSHAGTYQLTATGISTGFILRPPLINGTNLALHAVGGPAHSDYVLLASPDVTLPLAAWTPLLTNQFNAYGAFSVTNLYSPFVPQQFFRVRTP